MKILVTGATGFVGFHMVKRLVADGHQVVAIVRPDYHLDKLQGSITGNHLRVERHNGSTENLIQLMEDIKPETVFHFASLFLSQHHYKDIESLVQSNILFGTQLAESSVSSGVKYFINTGTSWQHYNNNVYNPACLYAATKQAFEAVLKYYTETTSMKCCTLKLFDTYGPEDSRVKLFTLLKNSYRTNTMLKMSPGEQLIDLVYIDDVVDAFYAAWFWLRKHDPKGDIPSFAVSSGNPICLREVVRAYEKAVGKKMPIVWGGRPYRAREVMIPWNKRSSVPGWTPKVPLAEGIKRMEKGGL
ncbi:MAG: NAD(P)-dependent oxidoreductase [Deltaproteobacteria bacterium]|nr:NAD(P)-dependent oxidoreductase [Deltaproteobacteria bacterium]